MRDVRSYSRVPGLVDRNAMGTAAGERRRRVNLADAENCVEGYFHFGARAEGFLALARREKKKKKRGLVPRVSKKTRHTEGRYSICDF